MKYMVNLSSRATRGEPQGGKNRRSPGKHPPKKKEVTGGGSVGPGREVVHMFLLYLKVRRRERKEKPVSQV